MKLKNKISNLREKIVIYSKKHKIKIYLCAYLIILYLVRISSLNIFDSMLVILFFTVLVLKQK